MDPVTAGLAVASIVSGVAGGLSANSKAKKAARAQAKLTFFERQEQIRQMKMAAENQVGAGKAGVYASNLQMTGTSRTYVERLNMENVREIAMAERAAKMEHRAIKAGASGAGDSLLFKAAGDAIGLGVGALLSKAPDSGAFGDWADIDSGPNNGWGGGGWTDAGEVTVDWGTPK